MRKTDDEKKKLNLFFPPRLFSLSSPQTTIPQLGEGGFACVYAVRREEGHDDDDEGDDRRRRKKKLFALKRVVASSRECLEGARREVAAARAAAAACSSSSSSSSSSSPPAPRASFVGLLPLLASEEKEGRTADGKKKTVEVLLLFPFCAGGSLADAVEEAKNGRGNEREEEQKERKRAQQIILSVPALLRAFADVAEGLSRLHAGGEGEKGEREGRPGLGHFDVKPHNIFLLLEEEEEEGDEGEEKKGEEKKGDNKRRGEAAALSPPPPRFRALLGDWGSARPVPAPFDSSHAGALAVCEEAERATTAAYRPPELWDPLHFAAISAAAATADPDATSGDGDSGSEKNSNGRRRPREVSGAADVWALGACLFACLGDGRSPSEVVAAGAGAGGAGGGGGSLALAACSGRIEWPPSSSSSSSSAVRALVERCLSLEPERRPSAAALAAEARALAEGIE